MPYGFLELLATPGVKAAQEENGSLALWSNFSGSRAFDRFTDAETDFIANRDSFYIATVSEDGWPYIQHRGGPPGFLRVLDETTLAFADFRGNGQYITTGNLAASDRVALFLMDYPARRRLKILAHAEVKSLSDDPGLASRLMVPGYKAKVERAMVLRLAAFDWNCPQHITPRFTETEVARAIEPLRARLSALESENAALRARPGLDKGD
jgi:predicted pyridoxine 5'-phosphate oxidase superfamily flavin-nucleotide-binding protein